MTQPYPLPRETRQSPILQGNGGAIYGPFGFRIFDTVDVRAWLRPAGADSFSLAAATIAKVGGAAYDNFTVTFADPVPVGASFVVVSSRLHERLTAITRGGAISAQLLEAELSRQGTVIQELRRDVDRSIKLPWGSSVNPEMPAPVAGRLIGYSADGTRLVTSETTIDEATIRRLADEALASLIGQGGPVETQRYDTLLAAGMLPIKPGIRSFATTGRLEADDGGGAEWVRSNVAGPSAGLWQHPVDGSWWQINDRDINPAQFGGRAALVLDENLAHLGVPDSTAACLEWFQAMQNLGRSGYIPRGYFRCERTLPGFDGMTIHGEGRESVLLRTTRKTVDWLFQNEEVWQSWFPMIYAQGKMGIRLDAFRVLLDDGSQSYEEMAREGQVDFTFPHASGDEIFMYVNAQDQIFGLIGEPSTGTVSLFIPGANITTTTVGGSNVDTVNNTITWSGAHGLSTGGLVSMTGPAQASMPVGLRITKIYAVRVINATTLAFYYCVSDAVADQNRINLVNAGAAVSVTLRGVVANPVRGAAATTVDQATGVDTSTDVLTTAAAHGRATGTPFSMTTTGTMPGGLNSGQVYFSRSLTSTTLAVYLDMTDAADDVNRIDITSAGSGTLTIWAPELNHVSMKANNVSTSGNNIVFPGVGDRLMTTWAVALSCTGNMPGGLEANRIYYVRQTTTDTYAFFNSPEDAQLNVFRVLINAQGTGVLTMRWGRIASITKFTGFSSPSPNREAGALLINCSRIYTDIIVEGVWYNGQNLQNCFDYRIPGFTGRGNLNRSLYIYSPADAEERVASVGRLGQIFIDGRDIRSGKRILSYAMALNATGSYQSLTSLNITDCTVIYPLAYGVSLTGFTNNVVISSLTVAHGARRAIYILSDVQNQSSDNIILASLGCYSMSHDAIAVYVRGSNRFVGSNFSIKQVQIGVYITPSGGSLPGTTGQLLVAGSINPDPEGEERRILADATADTLTFPVPHGRGTSAAVRFDGTSVPGGLSADLTYYARPVSLTVMTLHPTAADATANTNIVDITSAGTGVFNMRALPTGLVAVATLPGGVDTATEVITFDGPHGRTTGQLVRVRAGPGSSTLPGGLSAGTTYRWRTLSATTGTLHTTRQAASDGSSPVNITSGGTGTLELCNLESPDTTNHNSLVNALVEDAIGEGYYFYESNNLRISALQTVSVRGTNFRFRDSSDVKGTNLSARFGRGVNDFLFVDVRRSLFNTLHARSGFSSVGMQLTNEDSLHDWGSHFENVMVEGQTTALNIGANITGNVIKGRLGTMAINSNSRNNTVIADNRPKRQTDTAVSGTVTWSGSLTGSTYAADIVEFTGAFTGNRAMSFSTAALTEGLTVRVMVTGSHAFTLNISSGVKTLSAGQWATIQWVGDAWRCIGAGTL